MLRIRKQAEPDEPPGAPEWMVTFSDCMTLLLTFFVLLLSFSSFDEHVFTKLRIIFCNALPGVGPPVRRSKDAVLPPPKQIVPTEDIDEGSEKPTVATGWEDNLIQETDPLDFYSRKVFVIQSEKVFWGRGTVISFTGRRTLNDMAMFLKEVPNRVVISENGLGGPQDSDSFGLPRAWAVLDYLTTRAGLDKKQFSISAASTMPEEDFRSNASKPKRRLEIVLLERSIYN